MAVQDSQERARLRAAGAAATRAKKHPAQHSGGEPVVEFRGDDEIGLLCRITAALERAGLDVRSARVSSVAGVVVDAFYVTDADGKPIDPAARPALETQLRGVWPQ